MKIRIAKKILRNAAIYPEGKIVIAMQRYSSYKRRQFSKLAKHLVKVNVKFSPSWKNDEQF